VSEKKPSSLSIDRIIVAVALGFGVLWISFILYGIFVPAKPYHRPPQRQCINNLLLIDGAKRQWALELKKSPGDVPTWADLQPYFGCEDNSEIKIKCLSGGTYTLGAVSNHPTCSIPGHALP
jgi:hypothetical protein